MSKVTVQTRRTPGGVEYFAEAADLSHLEAWFQDLCRRYHPCGYGTTTKGKVYMPGGKVRMTAWRANNCD